MKPIRSKTKKVEKTEYQLWISEKDKSLYTMGGLEKDLLFLDRSPQYLVNPPSASTRASTLLWTLVRTDLPGNRLRGDSINTSPGITSGVNPPLDGALVELELLSNEGKGFSSFTKLQGSNFSWVVSISRHDLKLIADRLSCAGYIGSGVGGSTAAVHWDRSHGGGQYTADISSKSTSRDSFERRITRAIQNCYWN